MQLGMQAPSCIHRQTLSYRYVQMGRYPTYMHTFTYIAARGYMTRARVNCQISACLSGYTLSCFRTADVFHTGVNIVYRREVSIQLLLLSFFLSHTFLPESGHTRNKATNMHMMRGGKGETKSIKYYLGLQAQVYKQTM